MSPRRGGSREGGGQRSPQSNTVQDTDDRIPKENMYGTIRPSNKAKQEVVDDVDCLPPPPQESFEEARQPLLAPPKPAPRMTLQGQEGLDAHTPRSNRSIDSGLGVVAVTFPSQYVLFQVCQTQAQRRPRQVHQDNKRWWWTRPRTARAPPWTTSTCQVEK